jgi:hypothetical protein
MIEELRGNGQMKAALELCNVTMYILLETSFNQLLVIIIFVVESKSKMVDGSGYISFG